MDALRDLASRSARLAEFETLVAIESLMNALGWNALNITIMVALLLRARQRLAMA